MDGRAWQGTVHRLAKKRTQLKWLSTHTHAQSTKRLSNLLRFTQLVGSRGRIFTWATASRPMLSVVPASWSGLSNPYSLPMNPQASSGTKSSVPGLPFSLCPIYTLKPICWQSVMTRWSHLLFCSGYSNFMLFHCIVINSTFHPCPTSKSQKCPRVMINYMIILVMIDLTTLLRHRIWKPPSGSMPYNWSCNYLPTTRALQYCQQCPWERACHR